VAEEDGNKVEEAQLSAQWSKDFSELWDKEWVAGEEVDSSVMTVIQRRKGNLIEAKVDSVYSKSGLKSKVIHGHIRCIGSKAVSTMTEEGVTILEETQMGEQELKDFSEQWEKEWP
jgi:hypothetical protein